jgi:hypothetical protein
MSANGSKFRLVSSIGYNSKGFARHAQSRLCSSFFLFLFFLNGFRIEKSHTTRVGTRIK